MESLSSPLELIPETFETSDLKFDEDVDNLSKFQKSEAGLSSPLGFESGDEYKESGAESEIVYPYGENYTPISTEIISDKKKKLGLIKLFWPSGLDDLSSNRYVYNTRGKFLVSRL